MDGYNYYSAIPLSASKGCTRSALSDYDYYYYDDGDDDDDDHYYYYY